MTKYAFYVTTSQSVGKWKFYTPIDVESDIQANDIGHTYVPTGIDTTYIIELRFSPRIIQSDF